MGPLHRSSAFRFKLPALRSPAFLEAPEDIVEDIIRSIDGRLVQTLQEAIQSREIGLTHEPQRRTTEVWFSLRKRRQHRAERNRNACWPTRGIVRKKTFGNWRRRRSRHTWRWGGKAREAIPCYRVRKIRARKRWRIFMVVTRMSTEPDGF
jgi:hypothetical protein